MATKSLEETVQRMEDMIEIEKLLVRYQFLHMAAMQEETVELFALKTPGTRITSPKGVYDGAEGIKNFFLGRGESNPGQAGVWPMTTPVIEVAGDGKTAKALLLAPGAVAHKTKDGDCHSNWLWIKPAFDFVKEDGKWKFWHYHIEDIFITPFERSVAEIHEQAGSRPDAGVGEDWLGPDKTGTKDYSYSTSYVQVLHPIPPDPYETFDAKMAYGEY